jgi:hypothetical protein
VTIRSVIRPMFIAKCTLAAICGAVGLALILFAAWA